MASIATSRGIRATTLLNEDATAANVTQAVADAATGLRAGDYFLLTFAGHGDQVPDVNGDELEDHLDETWVLFDRQFIDDDLKVLLAGFDPGVRVLLISDSCHSGSVDRDANGRGMPDDVRDLLHRQQPQALRTRTNYGRAGKAAAQVGYVALGACQDHQVAKDTPSNGAFTNALKEVWAGGRFTGDHIDFHREISRRLPANQQPRIRAGGPGGSEVLAERVFTVAHPGGQGKAKQGEKTNMSTTTVNTSTNGDIWEEIAPEFEKALGVDTLNAALELHGLDARAIAVRGSRGTQPIVRTFWWGFHIEMPHDFLNDLLNGTSIIAGLVAAVGTATGPAAPFIAMAGAFVAGISQLIKVIDKGKGVYISMLWFAPGVFVPTTVL